MPPNLWCYTDMFIIITISSSVAILSDKVSGEIPKVILGAFGLHCSMPMVVFDWQGMTCYQCSVVLLGVGGNVVELSEL